MYTSASPTASGRVIVVRKTFQLFESATFWFHLILPVLALDKMANNCQYLLSLTSIILYTSITLPLIRFSKLKNVAKSVLAWKLFHASEHSVTRFLFLLIWLWDLRASRSNCQVPLCTTDLYSSTVIVFPVSLCILFVIVLNQFISCTAEG